MFVAASNGYLVIAAVEVEFGEVTGSGEAIVKVVDSWNGEVVFDCDVVECAVVDTHAHAAVFFLDEEDGCAERACGWADVSVFEVFVDLAFCLCEFVWCLSIKAARWDGVIGCKVDGVRESVGWWECRRWFFDEDVRELFKQLLFEFVGVFGSV